MEKKADKEYSVSGKLIGGIILIFIGLILLEDTIGIDFSDQLLPLIIIAIGIYLMVRKRNQELRFSADAHSNNLHQKMHDIHSKAENFESKVNETLHKTNVSIDEKMESVERKIDEIDRGLDEHINKVDEKLSSIHKTFTEPSHSNGKVKYDKVFGDLFINCNGINVENVEVSLVFGNIEIQMRKANFKEGLNRLIISNFIGDINIYIPKEIQTYVKCSNFIGDIEAIGKRSTGFANSLEAHSTNYETASSKLYIASNCFIGDIHIIYV